jgi:hypothetical protein
MFRTKPGEERALIDDWINRPALRKLVEAFGGTWPTGDLETVVAELVEFSEIWDYRAGMRDRHMFHDDTDRDDRAELTYWAAEKLGMINPQTPTSASCDYLVILGGLATGVEPRVAYAARLVEGGLDVRQQIAALGSFRLLQDRELPVSTRYSPDGKHEIDHLAAMLESLFHTFGTWTTTTQGDPATDPARAALVAIQPRSNGPSLGAYAAASSDPDNRPANTADTYALLAETNNIESGTNLLIVTSGIYLPYQHFDAVGMLCLLGASVETVGVRREELGPTHPPSAYRQEVRSALKSAQRLACLF